jgi:hypothetical protein
MVALTRDDGSLTLRADCGATPPSRSAQRVRWAKHEAARRCC